MAKVQSVDRKAFFLFIGEVNAHNKEFLGSSMTNLHGRSLPNNCVLSKLLRSLCTLMKGCLIWC